MADPLTFEALSRVRLPRQERSRRAFAAALEAFDALLRERPFAAVTMEQVATRAGLAITSVYSRFDGKAALVLALHERTIANGLEEMDALLGDPSMATAPLDEVVAALIARVVRGADEQAHVFRAVLAAADDETNQRAAAFIRAGSERLAKLIVPRVDGDSSVVERDVDFAWRSLVAVLQQRWVLWGAEPSRFPPNGEELAHRLTRSFLSAITQR